MTWLYKMKGRERCSFDAGYSINPARDLKRVSISIYIYISIRIYIYIYIYLYVYIYIYLYV